MSKQKYTNNGWVIMQRGRSLGKSTLTWDYHEENPIDEMRSRFPYKVTKSFKPKNSQSVVMFNVAGKKLDVLQQSINLGVDPKSLYETLNFIHKGIQYLVLVVDSKEDANLLCLTIPGAIHCETVKQLREARAKAWIEYIKKTYGNNWF